MITIKMIATGEIRTVSRNEAFDLVDRGVAEVVGKQVEAKTKFYTHRQMRAKYKTKN